MSLKQLLEKTPILDIYRRKKREAHQAALDAMTDEQFIRSTYLRKFGREIDLDNPQTFNEKLQWLKLYYRNPLYTKLVDKYEVKQYISEKIV